jgi:addiction module HigA family antidote
MARTAMHPGEHLAEELKAIGMSGAAWSRDINVPVKRITGIINGTRAITADSSIRLGHWFGTIAEFWLNLQKLYCAGRMPTSAPLWKDCPRSGRSCATGARARTRMRLPTFNRRSSRVQPRKCTKPTKEAR